MPHCAATVLATFPGIMSECVVPILATFPGSMLHCAAHVLDTFSGSMLHCAAHVLATFPAACPTVRCRLTHSATNYQRRWSKHVLHSGACCREWCQKQASHSGTYAAWNGSKIGTAQWDMLREKDFQNKHRTVRCTAGKMAPVLTAFSSTMPHFAVPV